MSGATSLVAGALALAALGGCALSGAIDDPLVARVYDAIGAGDVTVRNDGGTITLGGFVEGVGTERAYVEATSRVAGVKRVQSNIVVRGGEDG